MRSLLARLTPLHSEKIVNREMVNFQKWDFFDFSLYFYCKLCHYRSTYCFICKEQYIKNILLRKKCGLLSSVFKKIITTNTTPTSQEVGGVT